jgi:ABC-type multidrug transport system fused ATPase/permease subunit
MTTPLQNRTSAQNFSTRETDFLEQRVQEFAEDIVVTTQKLTDQSRRIEKLEKETQSLIEEARNSRTVSALITNLVKEFFTGFICGFIIVGVVYVITGTPSTAGEVFNRIHSTFMALFT